MRELELKYGVNPNQKPAKIHSRNGELPVEVLNGKPGYINFLDALNSYALVRELRDATELPAAASFKHVSPAGAAVGLPLTDAERAIFFAPQGELSPQASAYARARGADRVSSYGDWVALSDVCDVDTARVLEHEYSDGIIAPDYAPEALEILRRKKKGAYNIVKMDADYVPDATERRDVYGVTFEQGRNVQKIDATLLENIVTQEKSLPDNAKRDLVVAMIALKYTQSNSVAFARNGGVIGVGAGQQSRIHCTRLAASKADNWFLRQHTKVLALQFLESVSRGVRDTSIDLYCSDECADVLDDGKWQTLFALRPEPFTADERRAWIAATAQDVALASDAYFPFGDNVERAHRSGVRYIAQPGGSVRDADVIAACDRHGIVMAFTGVRLFHH